MLTTKWEILFALKIVVSAHLIRHQEIKSQWFKMLCYGLCGYVSKLHMPILCEDKAMSYEKFNGTDGKPT